jgi:hypothetical protein
MDSLEGPTAGAVGTLNYDNTLHYNGQIGVI